MLIGEGTVTGYSYPVTHWGICGPGAAGGQRADCDGPGHGPRATLSTKHYYPGTGSQLRSVVAERLGLLPSRRGARGLWSGWPEARA